jgi:hypothetical protein
MASDARGDGRERRADELDRLRDKMNDDYEEWEDSHRERSEGLAEELRQERLALEERIRRLND